MKANEFVKKYGWDKVKEVVDSIKIKVSFDGRACHPCFITETGDYVSCNELEPFVESHELVEKHGGLISARKYIKFLRSSVDIGLYHGLDDVDCKTEIPLIEQAIKDMESCL